MGKRDGSSEEQALFVQMAGALGGSVSGSAISGASKGLLGILNGSNFFSSLFGGKLFGSGSLFGGGFAAGGDVQGGVPITVGELGPETWTPPSNGHITPHNQVSNGPSVSIGSITNTDPVQTRMAVMQGMRIAHAQAVHDATHSLTERSMRTPR